MKKIATTLLAFIMLFVGIFCLVGCKDKGKEELIEVDLIFYETNGFDDMAYRDTYICELTKENNFYQEITLEYNVQKNRYFWATFRYPDGQIYRPSYYRKPVVSVGCKFLWHRYEDNLENIDKWQNRSSFIDDRGIYEFTMEIDIHNEKGLKETYGIVKIIVN